MSIDNSTVTISNNKIISLTEHLKQTSTTLLEYLKKYNDTFSIQLKKVLKESLGLKYSEVITNIDCIKIEPKLPFYKLYDLDTNIMLSELLYPNTNSDVTNI